MADLRTIEGGLQGEGKRVAVVVSRFNGYITESLLSGALDTLRRAGVRNEDVTVVRVPGCYELPLAIDRIGARGDVDAIVALGCVIRGATAHFDYVAGECSRGISQAMQRHGVPVGFGVLTTDTIEQAIERAGAKSGNKGADAAAGALEMASLLSQL